MKKFLAILLTVAMVLSLGTAAMAAEVKNPNVNDPNQYVITDDLQNFKASDDLWIGTLARWKAEKKAVGSTNTVFENGEAIHDNDIVITNGKVGAVLAVGTRNPWGYPAGSILDVGMVNNWVGGRDTIWSAELLINGWDSWAPNNCGVVTFDIVKYDFDKKAESESGLTAIKVSRIYDVGAGVSFDVNTYYGIKPDANYIMMFDQLNNTSGVDIDSYSNRFALTNKGDDGGAMFSIESSRVIGCYGKTDKNEYCTAYALPGNNISSTGDAHAWNATGGSVGYKELRSKLPYKASESVTFDEYIIVSDEPTTEAYNDFWMDYNGVTARTTVTGTVKDTNGKIIAEPIVTIKKDGEVYGWYMGEENGTYSIELPRNETGFEAIVECAGFANGAATAIDTSRDAVSLDLTSGAEKVKVKFNLKDQNGNPVYGKIELFDAKGNSMYPTVRFCGDSVYMAKEEGVVETEIAPGEYKAVVYGEGFWFYSDPVEVKANTAEGDQDVTINMVYDRPDGWLSADLHHHANKNDAFSDPEDVIPSQMASGLDVSFITDHDFTVNNKKAYDLAQKYNMPGFIPSEEISCSWAHFNVIPLDKSSYDYFRDDNRENKVMNQFADLQVFIDQTHETGASITANHPWQSYGIAYAFNYGTIPGGYTDDYDSYELNACTPDSENLEVILSVEDLWTSYINGTAIYTDLNGKAVFTEKPHYLVGGSDTHDVRYPGFAGEDYTNVRGSAEYSSGKIRTYAYVGAEGDNVTDTGLAYAKAVTEGHSYTTYGPLMDMEKLPGNVYQAENDAFAVTIDIESLADIKDIIVLSENAADDYVAAGKSLFTEQYLKYHAAQSKLGVNAKTGSYTFSVPVAKGDATWIAVMAIDVNGNYAITNPYWVKNNFADVSAGAWYADAAYYARDNGIMQGSKGNFNAGDKLTRGMLMTMLARMDGQDTSGGTTWYQKGMLWTKENDISDGKTPEGNVTREQVATMLYRYAQMTGKDVSARGDLSAFTDGAKTSAWAAEAMQWAVGAGVLNGSNGVLNPNGTASRAEVAQILMNYTK